MLRLTEDSLGRVRSLFDRNMPNSPMIFSVLAGRAPGAVYVDDASHPTACVISMDFLDLAFLGGDVEQEGLVGAVAQLRRQRSVLLSWPPQRARELEPPLTPTEIIDRYEFFDCAPGQAVVPIPDGHVIRRMDAELLDGCLWRDLMVQAYGSVERFLQHGFGLCLLSGGEICCEAYAVFRGGGRFELGAITHEAYRRQGCAYLTCRHLIELCEARGCATYWSCEQDNVASVATARKLGYRTRRAYQWLYYTPGAA
jgi:GNAT superfamily N-acetyltransferase